MDSWIERIWNDSVWSKVIAALVLAGGGFLASLWRSQKLRTKLTATWASCKIYLGSLWKWLAVPAEIPRVLLWLAILAAAGFGWAVSHFTISWVVMVGLAGIAASSWWSFLQGRTHSALERLAREAEAQARVFSETLAAARAEERAIATAETETRVRDEVQKAAISQLVKNAKASMELTDNDKLALSFIYRKYPASIGIRHVAGLASLQYPAAERLCEKLEAHGLAKCISGGPNPPAVMLTKQGRDYCIENGLV
jgi:hypothetical protein